MKTPKCSCGKCQVCYRRTYWRNRTKKEGGTPPKILAKNRAWRKRNVKKLADYYRLRNTGCTPEQFATALHEQDNKCGICQQAFDKSLKACADHDHDTQVFRGALCSECNLGLGKFKHDRNLLDAAIAWLKRIGESNASTSDGCSDAKNQSGQD